MYVYVYVYRTQSLQLPAVAFLVAITDLSCPVHFRGTKTTSKIGGRNYFVSEPLRALRHLMQCAAVCCSVLQCVEVCCSALQCVAVCCSVLQCVAVCYSMGSTLWVFVNDS